MPRGPKSGKKRFRKEASDSIVEDLDLDVTANNAQVDDDDVVHDRRSRKAARGDGVEEDDMLTVLPSDAHRLDGYGDDEQGGGFQEEETLAKVTGRGMRRKTAEEDFDVAGVSIAQVAARREAAGAKSALDALDAAPAIESIERDFAALTTTERLAVLKKESPELLKLLDDLKTYMGEVKTLAQPLHELLYERKLTATDKNLVSFLETKVQLMLSYCMHVTFYLLLKAEGRKVDGHPVIDHLVEIRVYLEKMWPLEEKLQYSLNRLLSGKSTAAAHLSDLRPLQSGENGVFQAARSMQNTEARERRQQLRQRKEAEDLEREEQSAMTRVRTRKASLLNNAASTASSTIAPVSYQEDEDQFFSRIAGGAAGADGDDDDDGEGEEGLSLMEVLRRRQKTAGAALGRERPAKKAAGVSMDDDDDESDGGADFGSDDGEDDMGEGDEDEGDFDGEEEEDDGDMEAVWAEEKQRQTTESSRKAAAAAAASSRRPQVEEVERRKAGKKIESHRGLTKARPKDRKNPRVAQRRKYERGMQVHKSQSRNFQAEPEGGFVGVRSLRPGVVRGTKL